MAHEINHDSSTNINDHYSTVSDTDGALTVSALNALNGSVYGVGCDYDAGSANVTLEDTFVALVGNDLRMHIWLDATGINPGFEAAPFFNIGINDGVNPNIFTIQLTSIVTGKQQHLH